MRVEKRLWEPLDRICQLELNVKLREWHNFELVNERLNSDEEDFDFWKTNFIDNTWGVLSDPQKGLQALHNIHLSGNFMFTADPSTCDNTGYIFDHSNYDALLGYQTSIPDCNAQLAYVRA